MRNFWSSAASSALTRFFQSSSEPISNCGRVSFAAMRRPGSEAGPSTWNQPTPRAWVAAGMPPPHCNRRINLPRPVGQASNLGPCCPRSLGRFTARTRGKQPRRRTRFNRLAGQPCHSLPAIAGPSRQGPSRQGPSRQGPCRQGPCRQGHRRQGHRRQGHRRQGVGAASGLPRGPSPPDSSTRNEQSQGSLRAWRVAARGVDSQQYGVEPAVGCSEGGLARRLPFNPRRAVMLRCDA